MQASLQSSISTLNLNEVDGERLFFHKNIEKSASPGDRPIFLVFSPSCDPCTDV